MFPRPEKKPKINEDSSNSSILEQRIAELEAANRRITELEAAQRVAATELEAVQRVAAEEADKRRIAELEATQRVAAAEAASRIAELEATQRVAAAEAASRIAELEATQRVAAAEAASRIAAEEADKRRIAELQVANAEGKAEGLVQGNAEGLVQGNAEGLVQGKKEAEKAAEATSLLGNLYVEGATSQFGPIVRVGTASSNTNPSNHLPARAMIKEFNLFYLRSALSKELKEYDFELGKHVSCYLAYCKNGRPAYATEADVQGYVGCGLKDATATCNILIAKLAERAGFHPKIQLETRAESSLFSNIIDHVVVYDIYSGTPILAVETKKPFDIKTKTAEGSTNRLLGQGLDQLLALKLMGHPTPFGLLTCHNSTHVTWLNSPIYDVIVESQNENAFDLKRLVDIIRPIPDAITNNSDEALSPSPIKIAKPEACATRTVSLSPESNHPVVLSHNAVRSIVVSKQSYDHDKNMDLYINAIFCSLDGFFQARTDISLEKNEKVIVHDAIGMTETEYSWDAFETTHRGPLTHKHFKKHPSSKLYLISYIGRGATSKVYRCITEDGYDCVAKIYVQRRLSDNTIMTEEQFLEFSDKKAAKEYASFQNIYGTALDGYVWRETLNNLHCIIMPFFKPIEKADRTKRVVSNGIRRQLRAFGEKGKMYKRCDQLWRHVGWFNKQIYLFDLGDLRDINDTSDDDDDEESYYNGEYDSDTNNRVFSADQHNLISKSIDDHMTRLAQKV